MGASQYSMTEFTCNACGFKTETRGGKRPGKREAFGNIEFRFGTSHTPVKNLWFCEECSTILDKFCAGNMAWNEETKTLALLDERFNGWWLEHCRMSSALKALGVDLPTVLDGTSTFVAEDLRRGNCQEYD